MGLFDKLFKRTPKAGEPVEINDENFEQMVLASDTPAVVDFYSNRCSPCHVMGGLLSEVGPDYADRVNIFKLNVDDNPQSATHYQVMSVPTLVFFKNHRPVDKVAGLIQLNPLRAKLDSLA
ncbi:MAG: thiol reductase thioredoxin [candidate division Zixibacteria bacterium]|nr:thiol reductase thioredoxin [candidate division Zixibacteria bacterium]